MNTIQDKIIVITGGAGVIGQSFVRGLADNGAVVIATDINQNALNKLQQEVDNKSDTNIEYLYLDITSKESIDTLIKDLLQRYGKIDAVINNAYPRNENYGRKLEDVTYEDFCENVDMHLGGYFLVAQQFCIAFKKQQYGMVINISSIYGLMAPRFEVYKDTAMTMPVEYAAIKSSIIQLTRYFAKYFKNNGIRVNCISPGGIAANQPSSFQEAYKNFCNSKGMLDSSDLLGTLVFLLSDESIYITGQNLVVDDGFTL